MAQPSDVDTVLASDVLPHEKRKAMTSPVPEHPSFPSNSDTNAKAANMATLAAREKPLHLLDLPEDILQSILAQVTHTNDLTALALTHSVLHDLVIPNIYSRFDIVWPEANTHVESRIGVDALTYGLATLVMASDVFGEAPYQQRTDTAQARDPAKIRRGNHYARYTRKFSLGNGPADWVSEYAIHKESGKMLGTLVALAVGRMRNLETFIWDMPTGVIRDVWLALASLGNRDDGKECRLEKIWVRWHENTEGSPLASPPPPGTGQQTTTNIPAILTGTANALFQVPPYPRVEFPTFSILSPLKSLNVLDIDEACYCEEMSILIAKSLHILRELRIGVADHAQYDTWTMPSEDRSLIPPPLATGERKSQYRGGLLGILIHRFCDFSQVSKEDAEGLHEKPAVSKLAIGEVELPAAQEIKESTIDPESDDTVGQISRLMSEQQLEDATIIQTPSIHVAKRRNRANQDPSTMHSSSVHSSSDQFTYIPTRLELDILELERVYLSVPALSRGIDWTKLTSITLLGCRNHEQLWKELRRKFAPPSRTRTPSTAARSLSVSLGSILSPRNVTPSSNIPREEYRLNIKKIHTDTVSHALIAFIKDGLAPDSLEWLFLQDNNIYKSTVTVDTIYKGAIRRHRNSLRKLLIDSESRREEERPTSWRKWVLNREVLGCLTSGKMRLRELSLSIDYKDWHYFLQRLPQLRTLRALHIAHIANHVQRDPDSREVALQVSDIVSLRPELELCYLGVQTSCYEVLECSTQRGQSPSNLSVMNPSHDPDSDDNDDTIEEEAEDNSEMDVEFSHGEETEDEGDVSSTKMTFKLREILFYDDKVSIFRARHGRL